MEKGQRRKRVFLLAVIFLLLTAVMLMLVPGMYRSSEKYRSNIFEQGFVADTVEAGGYWGYFTLYRSENPDITPSEVFFPDIAKYAYGAGKNLAEPGEPADGADGAGVSQAELTAADKPAAMETDETDITHTKKEVYLEFCAMFDECFYSYGANFTNNWSQHEYLVARGGEAVYTSGTQAVYELLRGLNGEWESYLQSNYLFYDAIEYDRDGNISESSIYGASRPVLGNGTAGGYSGGHYGYYAYRLDGGGYYIEKLTDWQARAKEMGIDSADTGFNRPRDMTAVYAVQKEAAGYSYITNLYNRSKMSAFIDEGVIVVYAAGLLAVAILSLILSLAGKVSIRLADRIPLELAAAFAACACLLGAPWFYLLFYACDGRIFFTERWTFVLSEAKVFGYTVSAAISLLSMWLMSLGVISVCRIKRVGIKEYILKGTLTFIFLRWIGRVIRGVWRLLKRICGKIYANVSAFDLTKPMNKAILKLVALNFAALCVICLFWFFGIIGLIIYSAALFILIRRYTDKLTGDYSRLLSAAEELANGKLNVSIDDGFGVFDPIGGQLKAVQTGFRQAVEAEVRSRSMKTELVTNVSHDLKTPLTAIITYVDLLKDGTLDGATRTSYVNTLDSKAQRLKTLIDDLFEVSKATSGNIVINTQPVDIVSLIRQVRLEVKDEIEGSGISFLIRQSDEKIILSLDGEKTSRIFENLILNVTKYGLRGTRAYIDIMKDADSVSVEVKNVSKDVLDYEEGYLTERFVRGDRSRNTEGSGLGLAIVKSFTELQGGRFKIVTDGDLFKAVITFKLSA